MTELQWRAYDGYRDTVARLVAIARRRPLKPKEHEYLLMALMKMRIICDALALHDKEIPPKDREKTAPKLRELEHVLSEEVASYVCRPKSSVSTSLLCSAENASKSLLNPEMS
jgi:hypothetical protein